MLQTDIFGYLVLLLWNFCLVSRRPNNLIRNLIDKGLAKSIILDNTSLFYAILSERTNVQRPHVLSLRLISQFTPTLQRTVTLCIPEISESLMLAWVSNLQIENFQALSIYLSPNFSQFFLELLTKCEVFAVIFLAAPLNSSSCLLE